jgi:hypothetical protein
MIKKYEKILYKYLFQNKILNYKILKKQEK